MARLRSPLARALITLLADPRIRVATARQLLWAGWRGRVRDPSHGWHLIGRLVRDGLLAAQPLDPERGRRSLQVIALGPKGRRHLQPAHLFHNPLAEPRERLLARLQHTQLLVVRHLEGWRPVDAEQAGRVLRDVTLRVWDAANGGPGVPSARDAFSSATVPDLHTEAIARRSGSGVRLLLPCSPLGSSRPR